MKESTWNTPGFLVGHVPTDSPPPNYIWITRDVVCLLEKIKNHLPSLFVSIRTLTAMAISMSRLLPGKPCQFHLWPGRDHAWSVVP